MNDFKTEQAISCMELLRMDSKPNTDVYVCVWWIITINYLKNMVIKMESPRVVSSALSRQWLSMVLKTYEDVYGQILSDLGMTRSEVNSKLGQCLTDTDLIIFMERVLTNTRSSFGDEGLANKVTWVLFEESLAAAQKAKNLEEKLLAIARVGNSL